MKSARIARRSAALCRKIRVGGRRDINSALNLHGRARLAMEFGRSRC